jgi:transposase
MRAGLFWLSDKQWARIAPHLPSNLPGPGRDDDRRIVSGIIYMLLCGCALARLPVGIWSVQDHLQSLQPLGQTRTLADDLRGLGRLRRGQRGVVDRFDFDQGAPLCQRWKRGEQKQAIGRSRGGRTTKIHALSDPDCRPCAFHLTPVGDS